LRVRAEQKKTDDLALVTAEIAKRLSVISDGRSLLVGVSGIDASGKGYVSAGLESALIELDIRVALISVDRWLNLPHVRFSAAEPGRNFYENALRLDEMFERLILPLKTRRAVDVTADLVRETATEYRPHRYAFSEVDVVLLEGIFLFQTKYLKHFDLKIWVECSFETALRRAVVRSQEGLGTEATVDVYETTYFPAERLHLERDDPRSAADIVYINE
jgi:uridine kinase